MRQNYNTLLFCIRSRYAVCIDISFLIISDSPAISLRIFFSHMAYIDGLVHDCGISSALAMKQSCTKPSILSEVHQNVSENNHEKVIMFGK